MLHASAADPEAGLMGMASPRLGNFTTQVIQRKDDKNKNAATTNPALVFSEIKKRNSDLAELVTPQSIDFTNPKEPPAVKGGPLKDGEEHIWKVTVTAGQGFRFSQTNAGPVKKARSKGHTQVTHYINIIWALPLATESELVKQARSENDAFTLSAAEPLFHELLHARLMMERDPHWTSQHAQVFQDFTNLMQISSSSAVAAERQALKQEIGQMAAGASRAEDLALAQDEVYEFLVHEKYDADTEGNAFGRIYQNALIAKRYSDVVALRFGLGDRIFQPQKDKLAAAAKRLFDKLDQAVKPNAPSAPTSSPPAAERP